MKNKKREYFRRREMSTLTNATKKRFKKMNRVVNIRWSKIEVTGDLRKNSQEWQRKKTRIYIWKNGCKVRKRKRKHLYKLLLCGLAVKYS